MISKNSFSILKSKSLTIKKKLELYLTSYKYLVDANDVP